MLAATGRTRVRADDSYVYGFAVQQITMPSTEPGEGVAGDTAAAMQQYPSLVAVTDAVMADADYDFLAEFDAGLDLVLDGIDRWRGSHARPGDRVAPRD